VSSVKFVSDNSGLQNWPEFAKVADYIFVFPRSGHLADEKPDINYCALLETYSSQKVFFFQCLVSIFKFPDAFFVVLRMFQVRMHYSRGGKHLSGKIRVYLGQDIIR